MPDRSVPEASSSASRSAAVRPPVTLAFLAPAERCNQRCINCYITEVGKEPVHQFDLAPKAYAEFVGQFLDAQIPILSVKFQGFEVTLPRSWPYLEAVFELAQRHAIRRSFVTNGMLLHKWADRIEALDVARVTVSLDGSSKGVNDHFRGLNGAFDATTRSVRRFFVRAPRFQDRVVVASLLRPDGNFESLLQMPKLLTSLGISHWVVSVELGVEEGAVRPLLPKTEAIEKLEQLHQAAVNAGIGVHVSDEYGSLSAPSAAAFPVHTIPEQRLFYRVYPTGEIHVGKDVFEPWNSDRVVRWRPGSEPAPEVVQYHDEAARWAESTGRLEPKT